MFSILLFVVFVFLIFPFSSPFSHTFLFLFLLLFVSFLNNMQVGDVALLRFVRGAMHNVDQAAVLFREHLAVRQELGLDAVRARLTEESKRKGGKKFFRNFVQTDLRHGQIVRQHFPVSHSCILFSFV